MYCIVISLVTVETVLFLPKPKGGPQKIAQGRGGLNSPPPEYAPAPVFEHCNFWYCNLNLNLAPLNLRECRYKFENFFPIVTSQSHKTKLELKVKT